jgi:regulator of sigma E protease
MMLEFLAFVAVFSLLVFIHELGHFMAAKRSGVVVHEFGFGFPPRVARLGTWRGTTFSINLLPLGGFVRMAEDDPSEPNSLAAQSRTTRLFVMTAGALMNLFLAAFLFSVSFMFGTLTPVEGRPGVGIYFVAPDSPAQEAGLRPGDNILSIGGETIEEIEDAVVLIRRNAGEATEFVIERDGGRRMTLTITPRLDPPENEGALGISLDLPLARRSYPVWEAVPMGVRTAVNTVISIVGAIRAAIFRELQLEVTGVIGMYAMAVEVVRIGFVELIQYAATLSVYVFAFNLLPLPALDGGRVLFILLEWVRGGRRVAPEKEGMVHAIGMILLLVMFVVISVVDYVRYFG